VATTSASLKARPAAWRLAFFLARAQARSGRGMDAMVPQVGVVGQFEVNASGRFVDTGRDLWQP
jgi:hypothetical protein